MQLDIMSSFFPLSEPVPKVKSTVKHDCTTCGRGAGCHTPFMDYAGNGEKRILIIMEQPTRIDDERGKFMSDSVFKPLLDIFIKAGLTPKQDLWVTHALSCYKNKGSEFSRWPEGHRAACRTKLLERIAKLKPHVVIPLGIEAIDVLLGHRLVRSRIGKKDLEDYFGEQIPDQENKYWICPTYSPTTLASMSNSQQQEKLLCKHMKTALKLIDVEVPIFNCIKLQTQDEGQAIEWINMAIDYKGPTGLDFEATALKLHEERQHTTSVGLAMGDTAYSFPAFKSKRFVDALCELLKQEDKLVVHNLSYEFMASRAVYKVDIPNFHWDTCIGYHLIDNRKGTSLKRLVWTILGVLGYDADAEPYIKGKASVHEDGDSGYCMNKMDTMPMEDQLEYVGLDALFSLKLYEIQKTQMSKEQLKAYYVYLRGLEAFAYTQNHGWRYDINTALKRRNNLLQEQEKIKGDLLKTEEAQRWLEVKGKEFNPQSTPQVKELLFSVMGYTAPKININKKTGAETEAADEEVLTKINTPICHKLLEYRKLGKVISTYLDGYIREICGDKIYTAMNLNTTKTGRPSASMPNLLNIPKHDKYAKEIVRSNFLPDEGCKICEYDFSSLEVRVGCMLHKDPKMIEYLETGADMHGDSACDIWIREPGTFSKQERQAVKGPFVFQLQYGGTALPQKGQKVGKIAKDLWEAAPHETLKHLAGLGISTVQEFQPHVEKAEAKFWDRFKVMRQWMEEQHKSMCSLGYIKCPTGFRMYGPMSKPEAYNGATQHSAFFITLWAYQNLYKKIEAISGRSRILIQTYDSMTLSVHPEDEPQVDALMYEYMVKQPPKHFKWVTQEIPIDKEAGEVDAPWYTITSAPLLCDKY